jgi:hypothetical protein
MRSVLFLKSDLPAHEIGPEDLRVREEVSSNIEHNDA